MLQTKTVLANFILFENNIKSCECYTRAKSYNVHGISQGCIYLETMRLRLQDYTLKGKTVWCSLHNMKKKLKKLI